MKTIHDIKLKDTMPHSIKDDPNVSAAADSIDVQLHKIAEASDYPMIYARLDKLPMLALDHLAQQFNISPWRDSWSKTLKIQMLITNVVTKRKRGTLAAVKKCLESLGGHAIIVPWYEQSPLGVPGTFSINITMSNNGMTSAENQEDARIIADETKPKSRHYAMVVAQSIEGGVNICGCIRPVVYTKLCNF